MRDIAMMARWRHYYVIGLMKVSTDHTIVSTADEDIAVGAELQALAACWERGRPQRQSGVVLR